MDIRIMDLPPRLQALALKRAKEYNACYTENDLVSCFYWHNTPEGDLFWRKIRDTGEIPLEWQEEPSYQIY